MILKRKYLIRFDDVCETMNWSTWAAIESCLIGLRLKPIVAVVPQNRDTRLMPDHPRRDFWERVRRWQSLGWTIALHGCEHRQITSDGGILQINQKSEFAGLPYDSQFARLSAGIRILENEGVKAETWVAPWHSFDQNTLAALKQLGIRYVSDGFGIAPYRDHLGLVWVPQQLWRFRRVPPGLWTVCIHHNLWRKSELEEFFRGVVERRDCITSLPEAVETADAPVQLLNRCVSLTMNQLLRVRKGLRRSRAPADSAQRYLPPIRDLDPDR